MLIWELLTIIRWIYPNWLFVPGILSSELRWKVELLTCNYRYDQILFQPYSHGRVPPSSGWQIEDTCEWNRLTLRFVNVDESFGNVAESIAQLEHHDFRGMISKKTSLLSTQRLDFICGGTSSATLDAIKRAAILENGVQSLPSWDRVIHINQVRSFQGLLYASGLATQTRFNRNCCKSGVCGPTTDPQRQSHLWAIC